jgi:8-oxo-dGTP pyrophosphatase MutT (NUDIX family)
MAALEQSAGFVVYRLGSKPVEPREYLLLDYGRHWDYPKGHIEAGETPLDAALRELKEETGIADAQVTPGFAQEIAYYFRDKKKGLIRKTVTFFLARIESDRITLSREHTGYVFEPYEAALKRLTYATARQLLRKAEEFLARAG